MRKIIAADPHQTLLLPPSIDEWIGPEHPARFIREFVDQLDLKGLGLDTINREEGGEAYDPAMLVGVWLYGYFRKTRSLRLLELACREEMGFLWLTGNTRPDHNALWRFWNHHRDGIKALFKQTVRLALQMDLIGFAEQALDGTKILARCSAHGSYDRDHLQHRIEQLDTQITQLETQIAEAGLQASANLPQALQKQRELRERMRAAIDQLKDGRVHHVHPHEPDSLRMKTERGMKFGHNAQAVADGKASVVVAAEIVDATTDQGQLTPLLAQAAELRREVDPTHGPLPAVPTLADAGYASTDQLLHAQQQGLVAHTPPPPTWNHVGEYHVSRFEHDAKQDTVRCPQGHVLPRQGTRTVHGRQSRVYHNAQACADCPVRQECTRAKSGFRKVDLSENHEMLMTWQKAWEQPEAKARQQRRAALIEPVFAQIKQQMGLRRWSHFGREKAGTQWKMLCASWNLRVIYRQWQPTGLGAMAQAAG